jgi:hypothetical protein
MISKIFYGIDNNNREIVFKEVESLSDIDTTRRFLHDNLIHAYDLIQLNGKDYLTLEVAFYSLKDYLVLNTNRDINTMKTWIYDTIEGAAFLHRNGIVHNSIYPKHILIKANGACLCDFKYITHDADAMNDSKMIYSISKEIFSSNEFSKLTYQDCNTFLSPRVTRGKTKINTICNYSVDAETYKDYINKIFRFAIHEDISIQDLFKLLHLANRICQYGKQNFTINQMIDFLNGQKNDLIYLFNGVLWTKEITGPVHESLIALLNPYTYFNTLAFSDDRQVDQDRQSRQDRQDRQDGPKISQYKNDLIYTIFKHPLNYISFTRARVGCVNYIYI